MFILPAGSEIFPLQFLEQSPFDTGDCEVLFNDRHICYAKYGPLVNSRGIFTVRQWVIHQIFDGKDFGPNRQICLFSRIADEYIGFIYMPDASQR